MSPEVSHPKNGFGFFKDNLIFTNYYFAMLNHCICHHSTNKLQTIFLIEMAVEL